ncbi:MAG: hypothetical protein AB2556_21115, partial [Candidatus Thiodiazotropha sp.]
KLSVRWHNKEFLSHKAALRSILQVIHHGLGHCAPQPVRIQGPYGISRSPVPPFKLARLVHIANADARGEFCLLETHQATRDYQRGLLCAAEQRSRPYGLR